MAFIYVILLIIHNLQNKLILIGTQRDPNQAPIVLGRTHGKSEGVTKIFLNPGWHFTKRSYQGQELSHFYFSDGVASLTQTPQTKPQKATENTTQATNTVTKSTTQETDQLF